MKMRLNPDLQSVRSMPILSAIKNKRRQTHSRLSINTPSDLQPKLRKPTSSKFSKPFWKDVIHPEVLQKYQQLQQKDDSYSPKKSTEESPIKRYQRESRVNRESSARADLMQRMKSLEEQNHSLREELYYLREALLLNFESRDGRRHG